ncbi:MAG TPA: SpoIIE family protein phosphatase [Thermoanaerobaculia bacterium]|nr:SpoIIE family protein phosphatase [Thermoanaerobaculia bacterium]
MSPQTRLLTLFAITLAVVGAGFGYTAGRAHKWHQRGWVGIAFYPAVLNDAPATEKAKPPFGIDPKKTAGEVMFGYAAVPAALLQPKDRIVAVEGIPIEKTFELRALDRRIRKGDSVTYTIDRAGRQLDVELPVVSPLRSGYIVLRMVIAVLVALVFIAVAIAVVMRRPEDRRVVVFYAFALVSAMALLGKAATGFEIAGGRGIEPAFGVGGVGPLLFFVFTILYAPLILHFALIFPRERPLVQKHPHTVRWVYAGALLSGLLCFSLFVLLFRFLENTGDAQRAAYHLGRLISTSTRAAAIGGLLLALSVLWAGRREGVSRAFARRPLRAAISLFAVFLGTTTVIANLGSSKLGFIAGVALVGVPLLFLAIYPVLAVIALVRSYREAGVEEKRQVQWPVWGLSIALAARILCSGTTLGLTVGLQTLDISMFGYWRLFQTLDIAPTLVSLIVPLSFAAAILKYRLMNIDVIIRKTVVYAILSTAILVFYLALVGGLGTLLITVAHVENQTLVIASTLVVALLFVPVRNKLQTLVDRNLFRHKYDYPEALRALSNDARMATDTGEFLRSAAEKLQQALQNRAVVIFLERQEDFVAAGKVGVSDTLLGRLRVPQHFADMLDRPFDPRRRNLPEAATAALARIEAVLVVPAGHRAFIAVAPKLTGGELDVEDIDFLQSAAEAIDMALDRIRMQVEEADFAQARAIQQTLLPREIPQLERLDIAGVWLPARAMAGDYYDVLKLGESELAFCIGDVAGKGMPAALLMSGLQAAVRASASSSPRDLCERVRRVVVSSLSGGRFVTFFYATIDTASMKLRWCNAGHNAPVLARADGSIVRLSEGGPAFSRLFRDGRYEEREVDIAAGDRLVLFTDGVSEAQDASGELFGEQRIEELVADSRDLDANSLQHTIVDASTSFGGGELEDDVTLVVVRVLQ